MKSRFTMLAVLVISASSVAAYGQTNDEVPQQQQNGAPAQTSQWSPPNTENLGKTRAQVYAELVQAQRDGQIAYLNRTLYAHH
ncbi:DUF4148 domain-containing protein [Paraburkholderia solisilvae]|uniref:DUF4148 domain-containing protein n=1 Tax=Paraburkholderia solisilvae TaxID=624376 RepID=A0A6J5E7R1_9BURK|nr:DUF4148 domain-containing protein [Paraburkholderia solisilvae]CAB3761376.1 hypothetical protein LMG29739_03620 [Paraburkholderia solisilvae]